MGNRTRDPLTGDFYPRSPRGERRINAINRQSRDRISIHALLAESDISRLCWCWMERNFYPRSPRGERQLNAVLAGRRGVFLSTLSSRRATMTPAELERSKEISIHALLAESDPAFIRIGRTQTDFYPRSPRGERQQNATKNRFFL